MRRLKSPGGEREDRVMGLLMDANNKGVREAGRLVGDVKSY